MKRMIFVWMALALAACGDSKDAIADQVKDNAENRAEAMEESGQSITNAVQQNIVEQQADTVREAGEERADAIRNSQLDAGDLSAAQKNELIAGE